MSSVFAHTAIAVGIWRQRPLSWLVLIFITAFCWLPDMDYGLRWLFDYRPPYRWSHSIVFVTAIWGVFAIGLTFLTKYFKLGLPIKPILLLTLVAGYSHLFMDWIIGSSWGDPLLWPFDTTEYSSPFGILPSSPKFSQSNIHMYKNLAIEGGIIGPIAFTMIRKGKVPAWAWALMGLFFVPFFVWGVSLPR